VICPSTAPAARTVGGTEVYASLLAVHESGFEFRYSGACGFTTSFDYRAD